MAVTFGGTPQQWAQESPRMISTVIDVEREHKRDG